MPFLFSGGGGGRVAIGCKVNKKIVRYKEWAQLLDCVGDPSVLPAVGRSETLSLSSRGSSSWACVLQFQIQFTQLNYILIVFVKCKVSWEASERYTDEHD